MRKSNFEELLKDRLHGVEETPPANMWARIEGSLGGVAKEHNASQDNDAVGQGASPARGSIRMPNRRRMNWTYAVASVAACVLLTLILTNLNEAVYNQPVAGDPLTTDTTQPVDIQNAIPEQDVAENTLKPEAVLAESSVAKRITGGVSIPRIAAKTDGDNLPEKIAPLGNNSINVASKTESDSIPQTTATNQQESHASQTNDKPSDMKRLGGPAIFVPVDAESNRRKRRASPVATSLYAGNLGGKSGAEQSRSGTVVMSPSSSGSNLIGYGYDGMSSNPELMGSMKREGLSLSNINHKLPISFGVSVGLPLLDRLSIESGITYTYMSSEWKEKGGGWEYDVDQKLHYIGIPVRLKYDFIDKSAFDVYLNAGGMVEKCVSGRQSRKVISSVNTESLPQKTKLDIDNVHFSVGANIGIEFKLSGTLGIYVEPGVSYYFKNNQPSSYRTENPLSFTMRAGLRINL